jgi:uncharacterized membrane protein YesL
MIDGLRVIWRGLENLRYNGYAYVWTNLAFMLLCVPVITAPAAWSALCYVGYLAHTNPSEADLSAFWGAFRRNLWRALPWGIGCGLVGFINFYNLYAYAREDGLAVTILMAVWSIAGILWLGVLLFTWPMYYEMAEPGVWGATRNALVMVLHNPLMVLTLLVFMAVLAVLSTVLFAAWLLLTWGAFTAIGNAAVLDRVAAYTARRRAAS